VLALMLGQLDKREEPLLFGIDETIERHWGSQIKNRGVYRDPWNWLNTLIECLRLARRFRDNFFGSVGDFGRSTWPWFV